MKLRMIGLWVMAIMLMGWGSLALAAPYHIYDDFGGQWQDADKTGDDDGNMCWAAASSNMLKYSGWGNALDGTSGIDGEDVIFSYFKDHWNNGLGRIQFALDWWFDGTNNYQGIPGWAQVDLAGGGFYTNLNFTDYYGSNSVYAELMSSISRALGMGAVVGLDIVGPTKHSVTCWGIEDDYSRLWITDSDDGKEDLVEVTIALENGRYELTDYWAGDYHVSEVFWLKPAPVPLPGSWVMLAAGLLPLGLRLRKRG